MELDLHPLKAEILDAALKDKDWKAKLKQKIQEKIDADTVHIAPGQYVMGNFTSILEKATLATKPPKE